MKVMLSNKQLAETTSIIAGDKTKVILATGREVFWRTGAWDTVEDEKEEFILTKIPAIDRLEEYIKDAERINAARAAKNRIDGEGFVVYSDLLAESLKEHREKWGL